MIEYKSIEYRLHESLVQLQEFLNLLEFDQELIDEVILHKELLKTKRYNVAVMGEFKRGKSSLINALLGARILPADATPTTATINRITYHSSPKTVIYNRDGTMQEIEITDLEDYVTMLTPDGETRAQKVKEAVVGYPTVICQNYVDIIDTPGLNDNEKMTQITIDMLEDVDGVIIPIHARAPFSETEHKFACQLIKSARVNALIFVVTFLDQLDEDDYVYETFMEFIKNRIQTQVLEALSKPNENPELIDRAHRLLDDITVYGISSSLALQAFTSNSTKLLGESRFEAFKNYLLSVVTARQLENAVSQSVVLVRKIVAQLETQNKKKMAAFNQKAQIQEKVRESLLAYCDEITRYADVVFAGADAELDAIIRRNNRLKNEIISRFIKGLSTIRSVSHETIKDILVKTNLEVLAYVRNEWKSQIVNALSLSLSVCLKQIENNRGQYWGDADFLLDPEQIPLPDRLFERMNGYVNSILNNVDFFWTISPLPEVPDLAEVEVIDCVAEAVDESVSKYAQEYQIALNTIRKSWFSLLSQDAATIRELVNNEYSRKSNELDKKVIAFIRNYQVFSESAGIILTKCENLWNEFSISESLS